MKLIVTGGGTGGHIYPALEVALMARAAGHEVSYAGSFRGQEGSLSKARSFKFQGFPSAPLYSLKQPRGWVSLIQLLRSTLAAKSWLKSVKPSAVFSTGGYSAAPLMSAAKSCRIPLVIHESNSVPGRSNRMFAAYCSSFTCAFQATLQVIPTAVRTGQPIRKELREAAEKAKDRSPLERPLALSLGGSQGSVFLNKLVEGAAGSHLNRSDWLLAAGKSNQLAENLQHLKAVPYLETQELADAYRLASVVVARSGGTLAEIAMFGLPSVLIPLPTSADDHQTKNAEEFVAFGAAKLLRQDAADADRLLEGVEYWLSDRQRANDASTALRAWDRPKATEDIMARVSAAAR